MSNRTIQIDDKIYDYLLSVSLEEHEVLKNLREITSSMPGSMMQIAPDQGQFMAMLIKVIKAEKLLEIGTYTGYSTLVCAMAMKTGQIITLDNDPVATEVAKSFWKKGGVEHLINLRLGDAQDSLNQLIEDNHSSSFDFIFIDADKGNYKNYYEISLELLSEDGIIIFDNVLWSGAVADESDQSNNTLALRELNNMLFNDNRIDLTMIPVGDGLTIVRKKET
jgi:predicted O-methyltransferase YrrM